MTIWSDIEELAYCATPIGELQLRRRRDPAVPGQEIFEIRLGEEFLMSSLFHASEDALAALALARLASRSAGPWDVVVGGLGLGFTARAALAQARVRSLLVVELLEPLIDWHQRALVPLGDELCADPRCQLVAADFFAASASADGFDAKQPGRCFDAVLLDIDHTPERLLDQRSGSFYCAEGLAGLARHLRPGGVFALWSDEPAGAEFESRLGDVFDNCRSHRVAFPNPYTGAESAGTVYVCDRRSES